MSNLGVVIIGRNEGERLRRCLDSVSGLDTTIIYVDSNSTDGSIEVARGRNVDVIELDMSTPFSAARARNAGFHRLLHIDPEVGFVQFLDGDCEVASDWLDRARRTLETHAGTAVLFGRICERFPEKSIYNRLADIEWNVLDEGGSREGPAQTCGGIAMMRVEAFRAVGGFDPSVPAGEEPELCQRLRSAGWSIDRIDADMTWHDSAMFRFRQWARRQVRTGYGGLDFATRFGQRGAHPFKRQILSARVWTLGWPLVVIVVGLLAATLSGAVAGVATAGLMSLFMPVQAIRIAMRNRSRAGDLRTALVYGMLTVVGKWFQVLGQLHYLQDKIAGRQARLIEHKVAGALVEQTAPAS